MATVSGIPGALTYRVAREPPFAVTATLKRMSRAKSISTGREGMQYEPKGREPGSPTSFLRSQDRSLQSCGVVKNDCRSGHRSHTPDCNTNVPAAWRPEVTR